MHRPVEITFRGLDHSDAIEQRVRAKATELEQFCDVISRCHVTVEAPHHHQRQGTRYNVRIDVRVTDEDLVVNRARRDDPAHEDVYVAIRDSFDAMARQLADYVRRRRGHVKYHEPPTPHAIVSRLFPGESYGFARMPDGSEVYFHANAANGAYDSLQVGDEVRIVISDVEGEKGPNASSIAPVGRNHANGGAAEV